MSQFTGYSQDQRYRVAWDGGASESMTLSEAKSLQASTPGSWIEMYVGWGEWEKVKV